MNINELLEQRRSLKRNDFKKERDDLMSDDQLDDIFRGIINDLESVEEYEAIAPRKGDNYLVESKKNIEGWQ